MCFVAGKYMDWSQLAFLGGALPIPFLLLMLIIPETPRWYVSKGKDEAARKALQWLRGKQADVEPELKGIIKSHTDSERHQSSNGLQQLLRRNNLKPLSVSLGLMFFQQFSGINAVIFYAEKIFIDAGTKIDSSLCTIILGVVNFIATFVATIFIDRAGRKVRIQPITTFKVATNQFSWKHSLFILKNLLDSTVHFIGRHDIYISFIRFLLLCEEYWWRRFSNWMVTFGQFSALCAFLFIRIWYVSIKYFYVLEKFAASLIVPAMNRIIQVQFHG